MAREERLAAFGNWQSAGPLKSMFRRSDAQLSGASIFAVALAVAILGVGAYALIAPVSPNERVALGHAPFSEILTR